MMTKKQSNHRDRRYIKTEKSIRAALYKLAETKDIDKIGVSAIAREANIDRKTFYLHYTSVKELVDNVINDEVEIVVEKLRDAASKKGKYCGDLLQELSVHLALDMGSLRNIASHTNIQDQTRRIETPLAEALIEDDTFGLKDSDPLASYFITFLTAGLLAMYRRWLLSDSDVELSEISRIVNKVVNSVCAATQSPLQAA